MEWGGHLATSRYRDSMDARRVAAWGPAVGAVPGSFSSVRASVRACVRACVRPRADLKPGPIDFDKTYPDRKRIQKKGDSPRRLFEKTLYLDFWRISSNFGGFGAFLGWVREVPGSTPVGSTFGEKIKNFEFSQIDSKCVPMHNT